MENAINEWNFQNSENKLIKTFPYWWQSLMEILVKNEKNLEQKKEQLKSCWPNGCYLIADFDRTLTYWTVNWQRTPSIISLLRDGKHLVEGYAEKAHAFFDYYHKFEIDPDLNIELKKEKMEERWTKHNKLLLSSNLKLDDLQNIATNGHLRLREWVKEILEKLNSLNIPIIIFSASGCGDAIPLFMEYNNCNLLNITYAINSFSRDDKWNAIWYKLPIIHSLNKDEWVFSRIPNLQNILNNRKNVIVLWDSLWDAEMANWKNHDTILKIWILTEHNSKQNGIYKKLWNIQSWWFLGNVLLEN